jgi:hypothetical protein
MLHYDILSPTANKKEIIGIKVGLAKKTYELNKKILKIM